jgi:hypothetical protein
MQSPGGAAYPCIRRGPVGGEQALFVFGVIQLSRMEPTIALSKQGLTRQLAYFTKHTTGCQKRDDAELNFSTYGPLANMAED